MVFFLKVFCLTKIIRMTNKINLLKCCSTHNMDLIFDSFDPLSKTEIESIMDSQKASCIHYAARVGFISALEYFIFRKNVSPFLVSQVGATILHDAAVKGHINVIEWILKHTDLNLSGN